MKTPVVLSLNRIIVAKCSSIPTKIGNRIDWTKENLFADTFLCQNTVIPSKYWRYTMESILGTLRLSSKYIMHRITSVKITNVWIFPITYCMKSSNSKCSTRAWIHVAGCSLLVDILPIASKLCRIQILIFRGFF